MASGDRAGLDGGADRNGGGRLGPVRPAAGGESEGQPWRDAGDDADPRSLRTPEAGAYGQRETRSYRSVLAFDSELGRWRTVLLSRDGRPEPRRGPDLDTPGRPVNAAPGGL